VVEQVAEDSSIISPENLTKLIQALPNGYRAVFNLYVMEGYTHAEISEILNVSIEYQSLNFQKEENYFNTN